MTDSFEREYSEATHRLSSFGPVLVNLIQTLAESKSISLHSVAYRIKSKQSTFSKLARSNWTKSISGLTDILGVRIITWFADEADAIGRIIEREFDVDSGDSRDRHSIREPDRFGYLSLHYVARISRHRADLAEYGPYRKIKFEVQVRSVLQDAWAGMDHELGYKSMEGVPGATRRRFARIASLLELVDDEFQSMRDELIAHQRSADAAISRGNLRLEIDRDSLRSFIESDRVVRQLDQYLAEEMRRVLPESLDNWFIERQIPELIRVGFRTIGNINTFATAEGGVIRELGKQWLQADPDERWGGC